MSRSAIDKLGKRLARPGGPSAEDVEMLLAVQASAQEALLHVVDEMGSLREPSWQLSHRIKTRDTIIEKVRRRTRLSSMQDIAGVRIVELRGGLVTQDAIVARLHAHFGGSEIDDRRVRPSHGYRAVHVIVPVDARSVEIQVRTAFQHSWADTTEWLADQWGRELRYGGLPTGADEAEIASRVAVLDNWAAVADAIAVLERSLADLARSTPVSASARANVLAAFAAFNAATDRCPPELQSTLRGALHEVLSSS